MKVLVGLFVASALLLGTAFASTNFNEDADAVVAEEMSTAWGQELSPMLELAEQSASGDDDKEPPAVPSPPATSAEKSAALENAVSAGTQDIQDKQRLADTKQAVAAQMARGGAEESPIFAMTCVQRKQEALRTLTNYNAAKTLQHAATRFGVQDTKAAWRLGEWHTRYISAASNYAFFCEQSEEENKKVAQTIHEKEGLEAQKAALRGLQDASYKKKERDAKAAAKAKEAKVKKDDHDHEGAQKKLIKMMADKARMERLRNYPQASIDLLGFVADSGTGKGISDVAIKSKCPFDDYVTSSQPVELTEEGMQLAKYKIEKGVTGPEGYRCYLSYEKDGYIPLRFRVLIQKEKTQGMFRHAILTSLMPKPPPYRVVLQYGASPADLDAHLQVFTGDKRLDIAGHRGDRTDFTYLTEQSTEKAGEFPFATMDVDVDTGYGPQQHSIHEPQVGTYGYYVKNYDHHYTSNVKFQNSDARVFLYEGNVLKHRYAIRNAQGSPNKFWQVFSLKCEKADEEGAKVECKVHPIGSFAKDMPAKADINQL